MELLDIQILFLDDLLRLDHLALFLAELGVRVRVRTSSSVKQAVWSPSVSSLMVSWMCCISLTVSEGNSMKERDPSLAPRPLIIMIRDWSFCAG